MAHWHGDNRPCVGRDNKAPVATARRAHCARRIKAKIISNGGVGVTLAHWKPLLWYFLALVVHKNIVNFGFDTAIGHSLITFNLWLEIPALHGTNRILLKHLI